MSTNPNNAVGTNAAYGGRTSVKAFNDNIGAYSSGILSGWACSPSSGMTVALGGNGTTRDIAIAEDVSGNKITVNNISEAPISVTMSAAPSSNSRIDLIVAYVDNPPQGSATALDNPAACGLITVNGTAAANPIAPNESAIRTAITADGASGSTAYYVILAQITIAAGTTDIVAGNISAGSAAGIGAQNIDWTTLKPRWKTVATSTSRTVTVPAGYRKYRINLMFIKPANTWGCLSLTEKTNIAFIYIQGVQDGQWIQAERTTSSGDKAIVDLGRVNTVSGRAAYSVSLYRETKTSAGFQAIYQATCDGSLTYVSGKSGFSIANGSANMTFTTADAGSSYSWVVEAFDE